MVKQQRWLYFHFGMRKLRVDIPKYIQHIYKIDYLYGFGLIFIGVLGLIFEMNSRIPTYVFSIIMLVFYVQAEMKFKIK